MKTSWIDIRQLTEKQRPAVVEAAIHARVEGIVDDKPSTLDTLPATVKRVLLADSEPASVPAETIVLRPVRDEAELAERMSRQGTDNPTAAWVHVSDDRTLRLACDAARGLDLTVVDFRDPTKIPLEIVIAAADAASGQLICRASDPEEAAIIIEVLEKGSEGVLLAPRSPQDVLDLVDRLQQRTPALVLQKLTVDRIEHLGLGDRVCIDTCTHFAPDEGMLIGSYSSGFVLCSSETHPLPYMPTRPFRVNAGGLHSYVLGQDNRTNYLSELRAGSSTLAVGADGRTRRVVVGRIKMESRPLLGISATSEDGVAVNLIVQDDWHVRVLGPGGSVLNVTELTQGTQLLGFTPKDQRHVGWPVGEFCIEK